MNKFVKYGTIAACVLVLGGAGIATAAFALGADPVRIWDFAEDKFDGPDNYEEYRVMETAVEMTIASSEVIDAANSEGAFENAYPEVTDLDIRIEDGSVTVYQDSEASDLLVTSDNGTQEHLRYNNMQRYKKLELFAAAGEDYRIAIPTDWNLEELEVEMSKGSFNGSEIRAQNAEFFTAGGEIKVVQQGGKKTSLESSGGIINWAGEGETSRFLDIESTNGGEIVVNLDDGVEIDQIGYDMECENAVINFYGEIKESIRNEHRDAKNGMTHLEIEAERDGSVIIQ